MQPPPIEAIGKFGSAPSINALFASVAAPTAPTAQPPPPTEVSEPPKSDNASRGEGSLDVFA